MPNATTLAALARTGVSDNIATAAAIEAIEHFLYPYRSVLGIAPKVVWHDVDPVNSTIEGTTLRMLGFAVVYNSEGIDHKVVAARDEQGNLYYSLAFGDNMGPLTGSIPVWDPEFRFLNGGLVLRRKTSYRWARECMHYARAWAASRKAWLRTEPATA